MRSRFTFFIIWRALSCFKPTESSRLAASSDTVTFRRPRVLLSQRISALWFRCWSLQTKFPKPASAVKSIDHENQQEG